jgi:predicted O-linked N-acetylglucosamine transferase (SPINDLY family)
MTLDRYADWLARGRAHQKDGRVIDALLCYRRALQEVAAGVEARFHVGEIAWQLGNPADAIAAWESAIALAANHLPSWHALADARAASGNFVSARRAARRVLELRPGEPRAQPLLLMLDAIAGDVVEDADLAHAIASSEQWPPGLLASVGLFVLADENRARYPATIANVLIAAERAPVTGATDDALRVVALALLRADRLVEAETFARRYLQSCQALHRPAMPATWPVRTAGASLRVGLIATAAQASLTNRLLDAIRQRLGDQCRSTVFVDRPSEPLPPGAPIPDERVLPADADTAARGIAMLDLDVLIDVAGLEAPYGPILARGPARELWALWRSAATAELPMYDRTFGAILEPLVDALFERRRALEGLFASHIGAAALAMLWEDAVHAHQRGDATAARIGYSSVLDAQPDSVPALYLSGMFARTDGDTETAATRFRAAVRHAPAFVDARAALVRLEVLAGNADEAVLVARAGLATMPDSAILLRALGEAEQSRGNAEAAAAAFAHALQRDPTDGETHYNHGVALQKMRNVAEAARAYQRALAFAPDLHPADFNLGVIFDQQGNANAAIAAFSNVLSRVPDHAAAYKALAETLLAAGLIDRWFANFERFERHCPNHVALAAHALEVCAYRADFRRLARYLDGLRDERFTEGEPLEVLDALQQVLYLLHFFDVEAELVGRIGRTHDALARSLYGEPRPRPLQRLPGKIRVGYLSGDFRDHVMGKMMWSVIRNHDRERFDVFGYSTSESRDGWTERYESQFVRLDVVAAFPDREGAERIAADDLDILVDLSTHTKGARPGILALKPARVQVTHVATAGTLAMSAIDFKLTDRYADVAHDPELQIEPPLVMEGCVYPYRHIPPAAGAPFTRERLGIDAKATLIGAFCTPLKLSQRCLMLWRDVLTQLPGALLAFSPIRASLRPVFTHICAVVGIDPRRIVFVPQGRDDAENQARYRLIDFVLDPMPYGGVNGTLEALDMGVPVVTLVGRRHAERTSYSILTNLGVAQTIAETGKEYVDIAVRLSTEPVFMQSVRAAIREALPDSPLTDILAHTRNLEQAYVRALRERAPDALADAQRSPS